MNQDYSDLHALYRAARGDEEPTRSDKRAVRIALVGAGTAIATLHTATAAGKLLALIPGAGKVLTVGQVVLFASIGAAVGGGLAAVGTAVSQSDPRVPVSAIVPTHTKPATRASARSSVPLVAHEDAIATTAPSAIATEQGGRSTSQAIRVPGQPLGENAPQLQASAGARPTNAEHDTVTPVATANASTPSLVNESHALGAVQSALNAHDGPGALRLLDLQDREFANGSLVQERAAARVLALCAVGRKSEARTARERFLQAYPGSPLVRRLNAACEK